MPSKQKQAAPIGRLKIDPQRGVARWDAAETGVRVRFFPDTGVVDYASARPYREALTAYAPDPAQGDPLPHLGQPLVIDLDRNAVFWLSANKLRCAPIVRSEVDWNAAVTVHWPDDRLGYAVIEHNLCQMIPASAPVPELLVARIDTTTLSLSLNRIIPGPAGAPLIGEHWDRPLPVIIDAEQIAIAALEGPDAGARLWTQQLTEMPWRLLNGQESASRLRLAGFTSIAAPENGRNTFTGAAADEFWGTGWYDRTRVMAIVLFSAPPLGQHDDHKGTRATVEPSSPVAPGMPVPNIARGAEVSRSPEHPVGHETAGALSFYDDGARESASDGVGAGPAESVEPLLQAGIGSLPGSESVWLVYCRRCGAPLSKVTTGPQTSWHPASGGVWCPSNPDPSRRRPHAPTRGIDTDQRLDLVVEHLHRVYDVSATVVQPRDPRAARVIQIPTDFGPVRAHLTHSAPGHLLVQRADGTTWRFARWSSWDAQAASRVLGSLVPEILIRQGQQFLTGLVTLRRAACDNAAPKATSGLVWSIDLPEPHGTLWEDRVRLVTGAAETADPLAPAVVLQCPFPVAPDCDGRRLGFALDVLSVWLASGSLLITDGGPASHHGGTS